MQEKRPEPFRIDDEQVKEALEQFENDIIYETGLRRISGGFASADIFDYDEEYFDIELKYGVQSDCSNNVTTEQLKMDRMTLLIS